MAKQSKQSKHGGKRPNAGRRPKDPDQLRAYAVKASLTRSQYDALRREASAAGVCVSVMLARKVEPAAASQRSAYA